MALFLQIGRDEEPGDDAMTDAEGASGAPGASATISCPWEEFGAADDDLDDDAAGEDAEGASADPMDTKKRARIGTKAERWNHRLKRETIAEDLRDGCGCGCTDALTIGEVAEARTARSKEGDGVAGPREYMRDWLYTHKNSDVKLGYSLHASEETKKLCATGFDILNGFGVGFTYKMIRTYKAGVVADDPNLGGNRKSSAAAGGDAFSDDTVASMAFRGWWADLRDDTEIMPNRPTTERQIDYIEHHELYGECKQDLLESGMPEASIGTQVRSYPRARAERRGGTGYVREGAARADARSPIQTEMATARRVLDSVSVDADEQRRAGVCGLSAFAPADSGGSVETFAGLCEYSRRLRGGTPPPVPPPPPLCARARAAGALGQDLEGRVWRHQDPPAQGRRWEGQEARGAPSAAAPHRDQKQGLRAGGFVSPSPGFWSRRRRVARARHIFSECDVSYGARPARAG